MNRFVKLLRADVRRKSRFHTARGELVLSPDMLTAFGTTLVRHSLSWYTSLPWLTYPAIRYLDRRLTGRRLLEFGSGTSTKWFAARCREVYSIENSEGWFETVKSRLSESSNATVLFAKNDSELIALPATLGGRFDAVVVDSQPMASEFTSSDDFRVACLRAALPLAAPGCLFVIDNTDVMSLLSLEVENVFEPERILRFSGWAPGIFHPNETTIVI